MIILLGHILRFIVVLLVVRLFLRFAAAVVRGYREPSPPEKAAAPLRATELVRDVVCNTYLPRERALVAMVKGRQEHFCSAACRDRALGAGS